MQYYFGKHTRYAGDTAATNSVLTVPVAGNHSGEPCHASAFADSFCDQAYRWNLDYVVDPNGNTMTYFYTRESNRYGQNLNDKSVSYHRGSYLRRVEYGQRKGSEHTTPAPARVVFTAAERCLTDCGGLTEGTAENWPDVPYDLICTSTSSCSDRYGPAFFSRKRLTQVETQVRVSGTYQAVDRWTLDQGFPDPGDNTSAGLWLESVQHSGRAGTAITLPKVTFDGQQMPNRVDGLEGAPPLIKYRIRSIKSETGAVVAVNYAATECTPATVPTPHTNTKRSFPVYWNFEGSGETDPHVHWFHKYVVDSIIETDGTGDGVDVENYYTYGGSPAWAYNDDPFTNEDYRTWGQWRGYSKVTTRVGNPATDQLRTEALYFRGLDGDRATPTGGTKSVSVTDSWGDSVTDREEWAGMLREEIVYDGSSKVSSTVNDPWRSAVTADDGDTQARMTNLAATRVHTSLAAGGWRTTETQYSYDAHGLLVEANDRGDISTTSDDLCTRTEYVKNTSAWIVDAVKRTETVSVRCPASPSRPADVVSDQRFAYDGGVYGAAPSKGNVTRAEVVDDWDGSPVYVTTGRVSYDAHGRVTSTRDALDRETTTTFTPSSGGPVTKVVDTNPAGHAVTTAVEPRRGVPTRITDANGLDTDLVYDGLGRLTDVWLTDRDKATDTPSMTHSYRVSDVAPVAVTTKTLLPSGDYAASVELYDSLLRPRQSQAPAQWDHGGRVISMVDYDSRGLVTDERGPFFAEGNPGTTLVEPGGGESVPHQVETIFDGAGRVTSERLLVHLEEHSRRTTSYGGDRVSVTPPEGGTASVTISDARGNVTGVRHYHGGAPSGSFDALTYAWTPAAQLETATDAAGNVWSYSYDLRGRRVGMDDPDAGSSSTTYDVASQVTSTTDARGETVAYAYDELGRKVKTRDGDGTVLAEWTYDTLAVGLLTSSARFHEGNAYTTSVYDYDDGYRSLGETVTIPASEGALAGDYTSYRTYEVDGSPRYRSFPAVAGLISETLQWLYDSAGNPNRLGGFDAYVSETEYSPYGEVKEYALRAFSPRVTQSFGYETGTHRLSGMVFERGGVDPADVQVAYSYDEAGNPQSIADTGREAGPGDVQCFTYDHLRRVTGAWSQTSEVCAAGVGSATLGGPAAYGQTYTYDTVGNRTSLIDHLTDTVTTYEHPGVGQPGPHTLSSLTTIASGGGETSSTFAYDPAGNTVAVSASGEGEETYTWDESGRMATATTGTGASEFVYAADGERLIRRDPDATTLYVFGDEITVHSDGSVSADRYYRFNGDTIGMHESPTGDWRDTELVFLGADLWGTPSVAVRQTSMDITVRRQDPFGVPRGGFDLSLWPGDRGFHTGTNDQATGLVQMGARYYQPTIGRFLSVDPLIDHFDPEQINGYAYANNNPLAFSDPAGLEPRPWHNEDFDGNSFNYDQYWEDERNAYGCTVGCGTSGQGNVTKPKTDTYDNGTTLTTDNGLTYVNDIPLPAGGPDPALLAAEVDRLYRNDYTYNSFETADIFSTASFLLTTCQGLGYDVCDKEYLLALLDVYQDTEEYIALIASSSIPAAGSIGGYKPFNFNKCGSGNSFTDDTEVLMADDTTKPIGEVRIGDVVWATDPLTGETRARTVTNVITGEGIKNLVDITIDAGDSGGGHIVTATSNHPIWETGQGEWIGAADLQPGDQLLTLTGEQLTVTVVENYTQTDVVYNLTVHHLHTYYVIAGDADILTHNYCPKHGDPNDPRFDPTKSCECPGGVVERRLDPWVEALEGGVDDAADGLLGPSLGLLAAAIVKSIKSLKRTLGR